MQGKRINAPPTSWDNENCPFKSGDYWQTINGWYCCTPNGLLGYLKNHHVEEHDDGTITVISGPWGSNSILVNDKSNTWHGFIDHGFWKEC